MRVTTAALPILRSKNGSTDLRAKTDYARFCRWFVSVQDVDWDTQDGHYRVRIQGEWVVVPDAAVVTEPNRFGPAVVWPYNDRYGNAQIRCFLPGAGT